MMDFVGQHRLATPSTGERRWRGGFVLVGLDFEIFSSSLFSFSSGQDNLLPTIREIPALIGGFSRSDDGSGLRHFYSLLPPSLFDPHDTLI
jgi:hypothetical protein